MTDRCPNPAVLAVSAGDRQVELGREIEVARTFLSKVRYYLDRKLPCPRCRKPITERDWEEGDHPCIGLTRIELGELCRELAAIDEEAAYQADVAEDPPEIEYVEVDVVALVQPTVLEPTQEEALERDLRSMEASG